MYCRTLIKIYSHLNYSCIDIYGEQGVESMHAEFNSMNSNFCHTKAVQRLKCILSENYIKRFSQKIEVHIHESDFLKLHKE